MIALIGITIDRKVTSRIRNARISTNPNTIGMRVRELVVGVHGRCGRARDVHVGAGEVADACRGRCRYAASIALPWTASSWPLPSIGIVHPGDGAVLAVLGLDVVVHLAGGERLALEAGDRLVRLRVARTGRRSLMTTVAWLFSNGNAFSIRLNVCMTGMSCGRSDVPIRVVFISTAGSASATRKAVATTADTTGRRSTRSMIAVHMRESPAPRLRRREAAARPFSTRSPSHDDHGRQHGQGADHRDRDDHHRAEPEADESLVAREEHAGHRDHHRQARDQHGTAGGRRGPLECGLRVVPGGPLLALAPHVEERVVDAHRQADQQDHLGRAVVDREDVAGDRDQRPWSPAPPRAPAAAGRPRPSASRRRPAGSAA